MAQIESKSSSRKVNQELNLIPFIDLMSVLICFLLITAVWAQISMMQIGTSIYGKKQEDDRQVKIPPHSDIPIRLDVLERGYQLLVGKSYMSIVKVNGNYDADTLLQQLEVAKRRYPEKVDAAITMVEHLPYEDLILGMDVLLKAGFSKLAVATGGAK